MLLAMLGFALTWIAQLPFGLATLWWERRYGVSSESYLSWAIGNWISRRHEFQADDFSRRMVGADPMVAALTKLSRDNAATLTPDPLYALVHYSHPPVPVRVAHLRAPQAA